MTAATARKAQQMHARAARVAALQSKPAAAAEDSVGLAGIVGSNSMRQLGDLSDLDLDLDVDFDLGTLEFDQFDQEMLQLSGGDESAVAVAASRLQDGASASTAQMQEALQQQQQQQQQGLQLHPEPAVNEGRILDFPAAAAAPSAAEGAPHMQQPDAESAAEMRLRSILAGSTVASNMLSFTIISTLTQMQLARLMIGCYPVLPRSAASEYGQVYICRALAADVCICCCRDTPGLRLMHMDGYDRLATSVAAVFHHSEYQIVSCHFIPQFWRRCQQKKMMTALLHCLLMRQPSSSSCNACLRASKWEPQHQVR
jgi:hypothetical protein